MKESSRIQRLDEVLRSSKLVAAGFMGVDNRSVNEVVEDDAAQMSKLGVTAQQIASRMHRITDLAKKGLGTWVEIDQSRRAMAEEAKGSIVCPWPHPGRFDKRVTTVRLSGSDRSIRWSDLNIHLIAEHGFFEGRGSPFRLDPKQLVEIIF